MTKIDTNKLLAIYGSSGFGREVLPLLKSYFKEEKRDLNTLFFIDDKVEDDSVILTNDIPTISFNSYLEKEASEKFVVIAIANTEIRQKIHEKCTENNLQFLSVEASNVVKMDKVLIDEGSILCPFVTLTSNIQIGKGFHANLYSYVAHDCKIGNFVTFAPAVKCNGNVEIEDNVYVGTGAIIKQGKPGRPLKIGKGAVIGAGAVVTKDVPAGLTVFGNPAIELTKENLRRRR